MANNQASIVFGILSALCCISFVSAIENLDVYNDTAFLQVNRNGKTLLIREELASKLEEEELTWHWTPWLRTRIEVYDNIVQEVDCLTRNSLDSFLESIFTHEQLRQGAFLFYALFGIYAFTLLAIVCNDFFIPCVELICEDLKIPQNVAAATFMAVATSCPEFFVNVISTFLTGSDMGIGTIVGSALFNALGVAAIGGLAAITPIAIERRPVTRDVVIYMVNVSVLVVFVWDGQIEWYESLVLAILYVLYFIVMFNSMRLFAVYDSLYVACCKKTSFENTITDTISVEEGIDNKGLAKPSAISNVNINSEKAVTEKSVAEKTVDEKDEKSELEDRPIDSIWVFPSHKSGIYKLWWLYVWPLKCILGVTIPSPVKHRRFYPLAFILCIVWIGINSYFISWSMTVIGDTFFIPESIMGMTFLAFGGCVPEACSIFIMSRRGEGGIGVSNALGANSLAILFALGLPWLIKTVSLELQGAENTAILINSAGIDFVVGSLLCAVACLWITLFIGKFTLRRSIGFVLIILYLVFITFAILVEMGIILDRGIEQYSTC